ncbi:hypothetical protein SAMN05216371_7327 [Streptomyces sp. TLI_053]|uniref:ferrous iron transport protein A n=1 Tax=Streptomyces sp. TLI_053 TaxID=1855352 RepID=UPI00087ADF3A|nr:ferrous iron transport protein A [Streptomyces sp. TLI_053]SDT82538.1 hypothetical protein SAMN05216371_7327 [Streptomyces sp. TLI_053]
MTIETDPCRDFGAVEQVLADSPGREWPTDALARGSRVLVLRDATWDGPWKRGFRGTIDGLTVPLPVQHPHALAGELAYWVRFDEPEFDSDGAGPYRKALIWGRYLRPDVSAQR